MANEVDVTTQQYALVTGGGGFIGELLIRELLNRGTAVVAMDFLTDKRQRKLKQIAGLTAIVDIENTDYKQLLDQYTFTYIFHLAGHADIPNSVKQPIMDLDLNARLSLQLLEAVHQVSPGSRLLFASSAAIYGESQGTPFHEEQTPKPISPYGVHKLAVEHYLRIYHQLHGLQTCSLRLFPVYGPGQTRLVIYDLVMKIKDNPAKVKIHGDGSQIRDFIYVDDVVRGFIFAAEQLPLTGEAYNLASGEACSIRDIATQLNALIDEDIHYIYEEDIQAGVSKKWLADTSRLTDRGFKATTRLPEGLKKTLAWINAETKGR